MHVSKDYLEALMMELTIMEGLLCELLADVCRQRERFRAIIDQGERDDLIRGDVPLEH